MPADKEELRGRYVRNKEFARLNALDAKIANFEMEVDKLRARLSRFEGIVACFIEERRMERKK